MKYFTIKIANIDGKTSSSIFESEDYNSALSEFYSFMASVTANENCSNAVCEVLTDNGEAGKYDIFTRE